MKKLDRINYEQTFKGYSTGYSSLYTKTVPYNQKTISQIKKDNELMRQNNRKYIETMYRTGGFFSYDINPPHTGTHRSHLYNLEKRTRDMVPELDFEKNKLNIFHTQCINMRNDQKNEYNLLRKDMLDEVNAIIEMTEGRRDRRDNKSFKDLFDGINKRINDQVAKYEPQWKKAYDELFQQMVEISKQAQEAKENKEA